MKATTNVAALFSVMLERPRKSWYGLELAAGAGIGSATVYAALTRLERAGHVTAKWENVDPAVVARPKRRLYKLTPDGVAAGHAVLETYRARATPERRRPGWARRPEQHGA